MNNQMILNIGSINWDRSLRLTAMPQPGETVAACSIKLSLGGKGLNQSVAIKRAGGFVQHLGAIGASDLTIKDAIAELELDTSLLVPVRECLTGSATILVTDDGENCIILDPAANIAIPEEHVANTISALPEGSWIVLQNETNANAAAIASARRWGHYIALSAAPFHAENVLPFLNDIDLLALNAIEYQQLLSALGRRALSAKLHILVTRGADGAEYTSPAGQWHVKAKSVAPVDTTAAGDTFFGFFLSELIRTKNPSEALEFASAAAALKVTRSGSAPAIPYRQEVLNFINREQSII